MPPSFTTTFGMRGDGGDLRPPGREDLIRVRVRHDGAAQVVEDQRRVGEGGRQVGHVGQIGVQRPHLEGEPVAAQVRESAPEVGVEQQVRAVRRLARDRVGRRAPPRDGRRPGSAAGWRRSAPRARPARRRPAAGRPSPRSRPRCAAGPQRPPALCAAMPCTNSASPTGLSASGPSAAVHRVALDEDGLPHVVRRGVGHDLLDHVATAAGPIPEMVVRVDDRQVGLDRRFRRCASASRRSSPSGSSIGPRYGWWRSGGRRRRFPRPARHCLHSDGLVSHQSSAGTRRRGSRKSIIGSIVGAGDVLVCAR